MVESHIHEVTAPQRSDDHKHLKLPDTTKERRPHKKSDGAGRHVVNMATRESRFYRRATLEGRYGKRGSRRNPEGRSHLAAHGKFRVPVDDFTEKKFPNEPYLGICRSLSLRIGRNPCRSNR